MPSAAFDLNTTPTPAETAAALSRRAPRVTAVDGGAVSFRQQFSDLARRSDTGRSGSASERSGSASDRSGSASERSGSASGRSERASERDAGGTSRGSRASRSGSASAGGRAGKAASRKDRAEDESIDDADPAEAEAEASTSSAEASTTELPSIEPSSDDETTFAASLEEQAGDDVASATADPSDLLLTWPATASVTPDQARAETAAVTPGVTATATPLTGDPATHAGATPTKTGTTPSPVVPAAASPLGGSTADGSAVLTAEGTPGGSIRSAGVSGLGGSGNAERPMTPSEADAAADAEAVANGTSPTANVAATTGAGKSAIAGDLSLLSQFAEVFSPEAPATNGLDPTSDGPVAPPPGVSSAAETVASMTQGKSAASVDGAVAGPTTTGEMPESSTPTEARFAAMNHARIASDVRGALMPNGGKMELRLDPPELGALQVSMHLKDGVITASFQTQNPDAARLLSHTLGDLRQSLEAQGVVVDKLHVQQAPKSEDTGTGTNSGGDRQNLTQEQQNENRREQQRKDMVQRLWDQLAGNGPIDVKG